MRSSRRWVKPAAAAATALVLPIAIGGFIVQRGGVIDTARVFAQVLQRIATDAVEAFTPDQLYEKAARGLVRNLDDPYAALYSPSELASFTRNSLGNAYGGVGVQIEDQQGTFIISRVFPNTPAASGGVQLGDRILAVDGQSTAGLKLETVSGRLTGEPGTEVAVRFGRGGVSQPIESRFRRARVHVPAVPYAITFDGGVGYIPLQRFNDTAGEEVEKALIALQSAGARSFVLDLRGNTGGSFDQSLEIANLFLPRNASIVSVRMRGSAPAVSRAVREPRVPSAPLVVLTDGFSASASEIVAGALQDHDRALLVGTTSFGKGLVQSVFPLDGGWALKMTTGRWYTPSGRSIQRERVARADGRLVETVPDSLETDSVRRARPAFKSDAGRVVYGGGGITPDLIIPADTISTREQEFLRALAPKAQESYIAMYDLALELKREASRDFVVQPAWRDRYYQRLRALGLPIDRAAFDAAAPLVDRMLENQVASLAFGDSTALRRSVPNDPQLRRALALLKEGKSQRELLARASRPDPRG